MYSPRHSDCMNSNNEDDFSITNEEKDITKLKVYVLAVLEEAKRLEYES